MKVQKIVEDVVFHAILRLLSLLGIEESRSHFINQRTLWLIDRIGQKHRGFILTVDYPETDKWSKTFARRVAESGLLDEDSDDDEVITIVGSFIPRLFYELEVYGEIREEKALTS